MKFASRLICLSLFAGSAWASLIPSLSTVTPVGSNFLYTYNASLSSDESLNPPPTFGVTCPAPGPAVQCNPGGTFLTIYDFAGFIPGTQGAPANWTLVTNNLGTTPSTISSAAVDNPSVVNLTFYYTGAPVQGAGQMFQFYAQSTLGTQNPNGNFSSQLTKSDLVNNPSTNGLTDQIVGPVSVPGSPVTSNTPEPASMFMMGGGLLGLGFMIRRRRSA